MDKENEKAVELTRKQMEKVSGGIISDDTDNTSNSSNSIMMEGYKCPSAGCGCTLKRISGKLYRCTNAQCPLFAVDQYPAGK